MHTSNVGLNEALTVTQRNTHTGFAVAFQKNNFSCFHPFKLGIEMKPFVRTRPAMTHNHVEGGTLTATLAWPQHGNRGSKSSNKS